MNKHIERSHLPGEEYLSQHDVYVWAVAWDLWNRMYI